MGLIDDLERTVLHDAVVLAVAMIDGGVRLEFEYYLDWGEHEGWYWVTVSLGGVDRITRMGEAVAAIAMEGENGGVLQFSHRDGVAELLLEWRLVGPSRQNFCSYEMRYSTFAITAERQPDEC